MSLPTKSTKKNPVIFYKDEPRVGTKTLAELFGRDHNSIKRTIKRHKEELLEFGDLKSKNLRTGKSGRPKREYYLNEGQFIYLSTLVRGIGKAQKVKKQVALSFQKLQRRYNRLLQHKASLEWKTARLEGKTIRRKFTDRLKELISHYENVSFWTYKNYTTMINKALFNIEGDYNNVREHLNSSQLRILATAEDLAIKWVIEAQEQGIAFKQIYYYVKDRMVKYGEAVGKTKVICDTDKKALEDKQ